MSSRSTPTARAGLDTANGIRQFIVGTGGSFFTGLAGRRANSQRSQNDTYGILEMTLSAAAYSWRFVPVGGSTYSDTGTTACHEPQPAPPPPPPTGPYWQGWDIARGVTVLPSGNGGYMVDAYGGLHPFRIQSTPPAVRNGSYWPGWDIVNGVTATGGRGGYVVDGFGGTHPWANGSATRPGAARGGPYWPGWDIARGIDAHVPSSGAVSGYVLDGYGGLHPVTLSRAA
jgi:hypothetical protein